MSDDPPSPAKLELIRRFLALSGIQDRIDRGAFLDRLGAPGSNLAADLAAAKPHLTLGDFFAAPREALRRAYEPHRAAWQAEYEQHADMEFTEEELREITAFLDRPAGRHYLEARWRMDTYIASNTEDLVEDIVAEARRILGLG